IESNVLPRVTVNASVAQIAAVDKCLAPPNPIPGAVAWRANGSVCIAPVQGDAAESDAARRRFLSLGPDPRVLVVATDDDLAGPLCAGLDALGWRTLTARTVEGGEAAMGDLAFEAALIVAGPSDAASTLKARALPRVLPVLALCRPGREAAGADLVMTGPPHPAQLALRLEQLVRGAVAEEE